jgi:hypothetical protein
VVWRLFDSTIMVGRNDAAPSPAPAPPEIRDFTRSLMASMITTPGDAVGLETSWETNARNFSPLVCPPVGVEELPQEMNVKPAMRTTTRTATALFKRGTPKSMMDKDLDAKPRIITEPLRGPGSPLIPDAAYFAAKVFAKLRCLPA